LTSISPTSITTTVPGGAFRAPTNGICIRDAAPTCAGGTGGLA